eukprot:2705945-Pyramimonas_sp.AAC.1
MPRYCEMFPFQCNRALAAGNCRVLLMRLLYWSSSPTVSLLQQCSTTPPILQRRSYNTTARALEFEDAATVLEHYSRGLLLLQHDFVVTKSLDYDLHCKASVL